jgi:hypothetical protein
VVDIRQQAPAQAGASVTRSCASLLVGMRPGKPVFAGEAPFFVMQHVEYAAVSAKPLRQGAAVFRASAVDAVEPAEQAAVVLPAVGSDVDPRRAETGGLTPIPARSSTHAGDGPSRARRNVLTDKRSWHTHPSPFEKREMDEEEVYPGRRPARDARGEPEAAAS